MTPDALIELSGLNPDDAQVQAFAPPVGPPHDYAVLVGSYRGAPMIIRGHRGVGSDDITSATATVSRNPMVMGELTSVEQERLRGVSQVASGTDAPVGQEAAIAAAEAKATTVPYAPPVPIIPPAPEPDRPEGEVVAVELPCHHGCVQLSGPGGTMDVHDPACPMMGKDAKPVE